MLCDFCKYQTREEIFDGTDYAMTDYCGKTNKAIEDVKECALFNEAKRYLDIDEQMHEYNEWEADYLERQAEFYESL